MPDFLRERRYPPSISGRGPPACLHGKGSFTHVQRGIDRALAQGVVPFLSITVTADSAAHLPAAVAFALDRDLPLQSQLIGITPPSPSQPAERQPTRRGCERLFLLKRAQPGHHGLWISAFHEPHNLPPWRGPQLSGSSTRRGGVSACQMEDRAPPTDVLASDPLAGNSATQRRGKMCRSPKKEGCRDCDWRFWCAGGLLLLTQQPLGGMDIPLPLLRMSTKRSTRMYCGWKGCGC